MENKNDREIHVRMEKPPLDEKSQGSSVAFRAKPP